MKISLIPFQDNINFSAKNKYVKMADNVCRKVKSEFPLMSSTYADEFYLSCKNSDDYMGNNNRLLMRMCSKISEARRKRSPYVDEADRIKSFDDNADDFLVAYINCIKKPEEICRVGNCGENARLSLAVLFANGYYNSDICSLYYRVSVVDKKTGEPIVAQEERMDHSFVITDMNKGGNQDIVVDSWLGFADHKSKALDKFNGYFKDKETEKLQEECMQAFRRNMAARQIEYSKNDYYIRQGFVFRKEKTHKNQIIKKIAGSQLRENFPELVIKKKD